MNENLGASNSFPVQLGMCPKGVMLALRVKKPTFAGFSSVPAWGNSYPCKMINHTDLLYIAFRIRPLSL